MSSNEIKIKITEEVITEAKQADKLTKDVAAAGGFSGQHGAARKANVEASLAGINSIISKGSASLSDIKELEGFFKLLYENLGKAAANTSKMSDEMTGLLNKQLELINKLDKKREEQISLLSEGKFDKNTKKFTATKESANVMKTIGAFKKTQSGAPSKRGETDVLNIKKNMDAGIEYFDAKGGNLADNPEFKKQLEIIDDLNKKNIELSNSIDRYEKAIQDHTDQIEKLAKKEAKSINTNSLPAQTVQAQGKASRAINSMKQSAAEVQNTRDFTAAVSDNIPQLKEQHSSLKKAFKQFSIYTFAVQGARKALNSAISTVKDLDRFLTEQAMVTGKTRKEVYGLVSTYQNLATQYNATSKEVAEVNTEFMRQGKSMNESIQLTEAALASARVAGISGAESVDYLTTALNGFQLAAEDAMRVSDQFAAVAAASATSYEEIAVALSKVASQANTAGMSIDYTTAILSKGIETTKEAPETIGTALKTIIARMRELGDYGETLSGDTDINNVETQLAYVGIELKNANGELRSTEDVLDELGRKWDTLSNNQQAAVAKALAGTRQQSRLIAMMSDYERVIELQQIAQRSQGSTLAQMSSLMTGLDASLNKIAISWEKIISSLVDNDFVISLVDTFADAMDLFSKFTKSLGGQITIYTTLGVLAGTLLAKEQKRYELKKLERQQSTLEIAERADSAAGKKTEEIAKLDDEMNNIVDEESKKSLNDIKDEKEGHDKKLKDFKEEDEQIDKDINKKLEIETANNLKAVAEETKLLEDEKLLILQQQLAVQMELARMEGLLDEEGQKKLQELRDQNAEQEKLLRSRRTDIDTTKKQIAENQAAIKKEQELRKDNLKKKKDQEEKDWKEKEKENDKISKKIKEDPEYKKKEGQKKLAENQKKQAEELSKQAWKEFEIQDKINNSIMKRIPLVGSLYGGFTKVKDAISYLGSEEFKQYALQVKQNAKEEQKLKLQKQQNTEEIKQTTQETIQTGQKVAQNALSVKDLALALAKKALEATSNPMVWIGAAIAGITLLVKWMDKLKWSTEERIEKINELSAENYKLNEQATAVNSIISQYEKLDNQVIKTAKDQEEMNKLLDEAAEKLDEDQKETYQNLTNSQKVEYLKNIEAENKKKMEENYAEQLKHIDKDRDTLKDANVQASLYAMNNYYAGNIIDNMTDISDEDKLKLEGFTQDLVSKLDNDTLIQWAKDSSHTMLKNFVNQFKEVKSITADGEDSVFNILNSEDYGWVDQVNAYKKAMGQLSGSALSAFEKMYSGQYEFLSSLGEETLAYFDELQLSGDEINELFSSFDTIKYNEATKGLIESEEQYKNQLTQVLTSMAEEGATLGQAVEDVFAEQLSQFEKGSEEYNAAVDAFVKTIGKTMEIGSLNMGQNIEKFENRITAVYSKATQWDSLSESEKTQFLNDNQDLFKGKQGAEVARAFETGNYKDIEAALSQSDILNKEYEKLQAEIDRELSYQLSLSEAEKDHAYVQYLQDQKEFYADRSNLFKISIEEEKKQQDAQLDAYRDMLQKEQDALTESLEKRKEAYEEYFDAINETAEDEDYEEKADQLVSNISKLTGSNAATEAKRADLEQQLADLEKERLQELRERAQEQIISNIEDEISEISDKFDKLLDSNQALLLAMTGDVKNSTEFAARAISAEMASGANTAVDLQDFVSGLQSNFGMLTSDLDFSKIKIEEDENKNVVLNVNGTTYNLSTTEESNLYEVIMKALTQIGKF